MNNKLLIGSHNLNKVNHFKRFFKSIDPYIEVLSPIDFNLPAPPEVHDSFVDNSSSKAKYYGKATNLITLSDDSGICVDALGGAPGVHTADWAIGGDFIIAIERMKNELLTLGSLKKQYSAHVVSIISLYYSNEDKMVNFEGITKGYVNFDYIDTTALGFQSVFYPQPYNISINKLSGVDYDSVHARSKALRKLAQTCFKDGKLC